MAPAWKSPETLSGSWVENRGSAAPWRVAAVGIGMGGLQERGTSPRTGRPLSSRPGVARSRPALSLSCRPGPGRRSTKRHRPCRSGAPSRAPVGQRVGIAVLVAADVVDLGIEPLGVVIPDQNAHRAALRDDVLNEIGRAHV